MPKTMKITPICFGYLIYLKNRKGFFQIMYAMICNTIIFSINITVPMK